MQELVHLQVKEIARLNALLDCSKYEAPQNQHLQGNSMVQGVPRLLTQSCQSADERHPFVVRPILAADLFRKFRCSAQKKKALLGSGR